MRSSRRSTQVSSSIGNRELKQLRAQLAALEERRAALLAELAEQGDHQA
jgi:hypothetical protein